MNNFWTKIKNMPLGFKVLLGAVVLVFCVLIYDAFTGQISDLKSYLFNRRAEIRNQKVIELEKEIFALRIEKKEYEKLAVEAKAKEVIYEERAKTLDIQTKQELEKLDEALAIQEKEEIVTALETDAYTRCERTKQKMLELKIKSAVEINCYEFKK